MNISIYIPDAIKDYLKILIARRRYPGCLIATPNVCRGAQIGEGSIIQRTAEIGPAVTMGHHCSIGAGVIIPCAHIGNYSSIAAYSQVGMGQHPIDFISTSSRVYGPRNIFGITPSWEHYDDPPEIGSDVWIGSAGFVRQGVKIGHGAIIGAGTVVVKDIPPYAIAVGVPARVIRFRFSPKTVERLLASKWWEKPVDQLEDLRPGFFEPVEPDLIDSAP